MIRFRNKTFEQWSICPATGEIFNSATGEVQSVRLCGGRPCFRGKPVHQIMAHTFFGYKFGYDVHHIDENPLNNSLSNLMYLTHAEHCRLHHKELLHEETRAKLSLAFKGRHFSEESRAKMSAAKKGKYKGRHLSEEARLKLSEFHKGKPLSAEHRAKLSTALKGKKFSAEYRAKLSQSHKGKRISEETRLKISEAKKGKTTWIKGKHHSTETRAKISATKKALYRTSLSS